MTIANTERACVDFHGVPIARDYEPFEGDAFDSLLQGFPRCRSVEGQLRIRLRVASEPIRAAPAADWLPTFCHGLIQGYSQGGAHLLGDGQSQLEVLPSEARLSGQLFEPGRELFNGMQHIGLSLLLRERGIFDLHAATACTERQALVLLGDSGAGKTTLLLCLMASGCSFLGDDRLLFRAAQGQPELLAYPREFHLTARTLQLVASTPPSSRREPRVDGKYALQPLTHWPERFRRSWRGPISLLVPRIDSVPTSSVRRATAAEAFGHLLSSSAAVAIEAIDRRTEQLDALRVLANSAHAYSVSLGTDLLREPERTARALLSQIDALASAS